MWLLLVRHSIGPLSLRSNRCTHWHACTRRAYFFWHSPSPTTQFRPKRIYCCIHRPMVRRYRHYMHRHRLAISLLFPKWKKYSHLFKLIFSNAIFTDLHKSLCPKYSVTDHRWHLTSGMFLNQAMARPPHEDHGTPNFCYLQLNSTNKQTIQWIWSIWSFEWFWKYDTEATKRPSEPNICVTNDHSDNTKHIWFFVWQMR